MGNIDTYHIVSMKGGEVPELQNPKFIQGVVVEYVPIYSVVSDFVKCIANM